MKIRIYLDNNLISYILNVIQKKKTDNLVTLLEMASLVFLSNIRTINIEFLVSDESLTEIKRLPDLSVKRKDLENLYFKLKQGKPVIRNATVKYDDGISFYDSPDISYDHPYDDTDLNKVRQFLKNKGNINDFDARYIANAMLIKNKVDFFLTADKKSIWNYKNEIEEKFGVKIRLPSEIAEYLKHIE